MKKIFVSLVAGLFLIPTIALAEFKQETQKDVTDLVIQFYQSTQGNKVNAYMVDGLILRVNQVFQKNIVIPKPKNISAPKLEK